MIRTSSGNNTTKSKKLGSQLGMHLVNKDSKIQGGTVITKKIHSEETYYEKAYIQKNNSHRSEYTEISDFLSIGRDPMHRLCLSDPFASSHHARIERTQSGVFILRDLQSKNGVFLNGAQVKEAVLSANDCISIGQEKFYFRINKLKNEETYLFSKNKSWQTQLNSIPQIAKSHFPTLIFGPSGTGKDRLAHLIHEMSDKALGPFISVNCGALSETLIESELFGHIKGSFTGAINNRKGAFESARGGTLFLDEIGDLPLTLQPKILRALENKEIKSVGSDQIIKTNVRIITATHQNLKRHVEQKKFRQDLYYRLHTVQLSPPPLNQRMEDFETLAYKFSREMRVKFSYEAIKKMQEYHWPGNIRELKNIVSKASIYFKGIRISAKEIETLIDSFDKKPLPPDPGNTSTMKQLKEFEKDIICKELAKTNGNQRKASLNIGMPRSTFNDKIKKYKINIKEVVRTGWSL